MKMNPVEIIILILVAAVAVRISFKFDLNKHLESRRKIKINQLKNICPHGHIQEMQGKKIIFEPYFSSPMGTLNYICSQCGLVVGSKDEVNRIMRSYSGDLGLILKKQKKFFKKAKKLKLI